ncbi:hypothetical protein ACFX5K_00125 [Rickettsiales bacterium LUAb2]
MSKLLFEQNLTNMVIGKISPNIPNISILKANRTNSVISIEGIDAEFNAAMNVTPTNIKGVGSLVNINGDSYYLENLVYYPELKSLLQKLENLTKALQSSVGTATVTALGTPAPINNDPNLVTAAKDLEQTIEPLINKLP